MMRWAYLPTLVPMLGLWIADRLIRRAARPTGAAVAPPALPAPPTTDNKETHAMGFNSMSVICKYCATTILGYVVEPRPNFETRPHWRKSKQDDITKALYLCPICDRPEHGLLDAADQQLLDTYARWHAFQEEEIRRHAEKLAREALEGTDDA